MLYYHFNNNFRIRTFFENIDSIAKYQKTGIWEHSSKGLKDLRKAKKETFPTYELYFGLVPDSHNIDLVIDGKRDYVVAEFIKKFQYTNPKQSKEPSVGSFYKKQLEEKQRIAPLRILLQLLFYSAIYKNKNMLSVDMFTKYILANEELVKNDNEIDIPTLYNQIEQDTENFDFYGPNVKYTGGTKKRFVDCILYVLEISGYVSLRDNLIILNFNTLNSQKRDLFYLIISYKDYFLSYGIGESQARKNYIEYMQSAEPLSGKTKDLQPKASLETFGINKIFYGAPGTGKSFNIEKFIKNNGISGYSENDGHENVFRTTLHPEFTYSDFIGQVMPVVKKNESNNSNNEIIYEFKKQIFTKALEKAFNSKEEPVFLILEEMSRANVAAVFGDIFLLLDRKENGESEYRINNQLIADSIFKEEDRTIYLPKNLFILGTVNTSDQNVFVMDTAFKRRFEFEYVDVMNMVSKEGELLNNFKFYLSNEDGELKSYFWTDFVSYLNSFIVTELELSEDKQVGQFFVKFKPDNFENKSYNLGQLLGKVFQYLWSDIQEATFTDKKLFKDELKSFGQMYRAFDSGENIFSEEFLVGLPESI